MSKEALDRVVEGAFDNKHKDCKNITFSAADDDVKIGEWCALGMGNKFETTICRSFKSTRNCAFSTNHDFLNQKMRIFKSTF